MLASEQESVQGQRCFVLRPDIGLHWRESRLVYGVAALTSLSVAMAFAVAGYWPILPLAGLEIGALGGALYISAQRGHDREVIRITDRTITIETGRREPSQSWELDRYWSEVRLLPPAHPWYPSRLVIRSGGREFEFGSFLVEDDRKAIAAELSRIIGPMADRGGL